ncbi:hypothetical protein L596_025089 [Steinernema carpocapsae]|uniref:18S rRNA (guanine-N(7))-methyltransferase n=1 Tax=Steinernema carpocapsae TaxID=34508 RepID=A0A4U5M6X9_STECR|nr:hypothetical protein L596_025089 [Steinernema carpocapsae]
MGKTDRSFAADSLQMIPLYLLTTAMSSHARPEHLGPPELYYNENEAKKYHCNSHIMAIQAEMSERALELLALPEDSPALLLDIGCGSGLSGQILTDAGHTWIGMDISPHMLEVARDDEECEGDLILKDMGTGMPFRPGTFDGAISISAIQWLCHANASDENPRKRLHRFFQSLYAVMGRGTRAVFQFYPENTQQSDLITQQAMKAGFNGGMVVDYPNSTKAKKSVTVYADVFVSKHVRISVFSLDMAWTDVRNSLNSS